MSLSNINLNLIPVLYSLLKERNVSLAASRLKIHQSGMSRYLHLLRELFNDELLVKGTSTAIMDLTPKALQLYHLAEQTLQDMKHVFAAAAEFDIKEIRASFTVALTKWVSDYIMPDLISAIEKEAPNINLSIITMNNFYSRKYSKINEIDLVITMTNLDPPAYRHEMLASSAYVYVISKNNASFKKQKPVNEIIREFKHILTFSSNVISANSSWHLFYKKLIEESPQFKFIEIPYLTSALNVIEKGDYIIMLPEVLARRIGASRRIEILKIPDAFLECEWRMLWDNEKDKDPVNIWFRNKFKDVFKRLGGNGTF